MPDVIKNIAVDEHYTITSSVVASTSDQSDLLKGYAAGSIIGRVLSKPVIVKVSVPTVARTIVVNRFIRDKSKTLKPIEMEQRPEDSLLNRIKLKVDKITPDHSVPFDPILLSFGKKKLKSPRMMETIEAEKESGLLAVAKRTGRKPQGQEFFTMKEAMSQRKEGRMAYSQLKRQSGAMDSLRLREKSSIGIIESLRSENVQLKSSAEGARKSLNMINVELKSLKTEINTKYVSKMRYQKDIANLQASLQKYAKVATRTKKGYEEMELAPPAGKKVGDVGKMTEIEKLTETRRKTTLGKQFNMLGMKARR